MEAKKKYFMDCNLAGLQYHEACEVWDNLKVGTVLKLVRDTNNNYDHDAVAMVYEDTEIKDEFCVGYIPRRENKDLAAFLDMGWTDIFECRINKINEKAHPEQQIYLTIKIKKKTS